MWEKIKFYSSINFIHEKCLGFIPHGIYIEWKIHETIMFNLRYNFMHDFKENIKLEIERKVNYCARNNIRL